MTHPTPPIEVALGCRHKDAIDDILSSAIADGTMVGAVVMAGRIDRPLYQGAFGYRDREVGVAAAIDDVFMLASLTKTVTAVAAMQLVERGKLALDEPLGAILPRLAYPEVLEGFDADGRPMLRAARCPITLRHLLTHTSGFGHEIWDEALLRYQSATGTPGLGSQTNASLHVPLLSDPGEQWRYSIGLEWTGKVIEAVTGSTLGVYLRDNIFTPLGMDDTGFGVMPCHAGRVSSVYRREPNGDLRSIDFAITPGEYEAGGGGLYGTASDYFRFLSMLLHGGRLGPVEIITPVTAALMGQNQIGNMTVSAMKTAQPALSNDVEFYPHMPKTWGLSGMITTDAGPDGRSAGSIAWAGLANCYFWIDPVRKISVVFLTQILPFADARTLRVLVDFERHLYRGLSETSP